MEKMSSSVQSWADQHKLATVGAMWTTAVGASVACGRRRGKAAGFTVAAALGGAALAHQYYAAKRREEEARCFELDFYSQLPAATGEDGQENERWSY
ncbi:hypothetical protein CFC21_065257 [Triticum aestivum]|uniref:HIG1 domain-containing protein n=3 Tax=Triticum TaxID=4564 RepID=A0A9R0TRK1_TRITD|nr:uncharacterized protein LOC119300965 [Triticum dicoccoides]XP_044380613.1 uncharacterized protein LOC123103180 [Triticum aestivum]XP_048529420.1 uncharacterized protein LOC125508692 [Triticum urartu]KAF7058130.1 hypothetical protein CFC21_065257 [Triticum aestivum]VAI16050.1 unnamed protein product [Triticum turgidum subsp. durum]